MGTSLINIGVSGLKAQQAALATTGHNITNASTKGYTRQRVALEAHPPQYAGAGYIGRGVTLASVTRVANDYATNQVRLDTSVFSGLDTFLDQIGQVDAVLADDLSGLAPALQTFFGALQAASSDPSSIPTRQLVISDANGLVSRFNTMFERLNTQQRGLDQQLSTSTIRVNELAQGIGRLNDRIASSDGRSIGVVPNDLLDQREELLRQLAEVVDVKVVPQNDGQLSVFIGKGQPLIIGNQVRALKAIGNGQITLGNADGSQGQNVTDSIAGGQLGGFVEFRNGVLDGALNQLGRIAIALADSINQQHRNGVTLEGAFGGDLFAPVNDRSAISQRASAVNIAQGYVPGQLDVVIDSPAQLSTSDYEVRFDRVGNGSFALVRRDDGKVVAEGSVSQGLPASVSADGFTVTIQSGQFHGGDRYLVQPTRSGARDITQLIGSAADLAFSSPVRANSSFGNQGSGVVTPSAVLDIAHPSFSVKGTLTPPLLIRFTSDTSYEILDNSDPSAPRPLQPPLRNLPYVPGIENSLLPGSLGQTRVGSNGGNVARLTSGAAPTLGLIPAPNGYDPEQIQVARIDANGFALGAQSLTVAADASARTIAEGLSALTGVAATAQTNVDITAINNDGIGVPLAIVINGVRFAGADVASLDTLADAIARNATFASAGIAARSDGARLQLSCAYGDDLNLYVSGDGADRISLAGPKGDVLTLNGAGAGVSAQLLGSVDRSAGFDFSTGGPYTFDLAVDQGPSKAITMSGVYPSGAALVAALQSAIDASGIGAGRVLVNLDGSGRLVLASLGSGADSTISLSGAPAGSPAAIALGITNDSNTGVDSYRSATIGGSVSVLLDTNYRLSTDSTTVSGNIFTQTPPAVRADFGYQLTMTGRPRAGDSFDTSFNDGGVSDNANVLAMADVQTRKLFGKDGSLFDAYANIVEFVGARASEARIDRDASEGMLRQSIARRESISGVNLDEEAADLIRFEQAYNAAARVVAVARDTFDTLFRLVS